MSLQKNVQQQNDDAYAEILNFAKSYRSNASDNNWVRQTLIAAKLNADDGVLIGQWSVPCGGDEESAEVLWLTQDKKFYSVEATLVASHLHGQTIRKLVEIESVADITSKMEPNAHQKGRGKNKAALALEVFEEINNSHKALDSRLRGNDK